MVWQGSDGALDQDLEELMPEGPQRTLLDWKNLGKYAPDVDDPRTTPLPADRATLRRPGRVSSGRGYLRLPLSVDTVARIFELRDEGLSFKKIGKALGIAAWTVSRYVRSFEGSVPPMRPARRTAIHPRRAPNVDIAARLALSHHIDSRPARCRSRIAWRINAYDPTATGTVKRPSTNLRRPRGRKALSAHLPPR